MCIVLHTPSPYTESAHSRRKHKPSEFEFLYSAVTAFKQTIRFEQEMMAVYQITFLSTYVFIVKHVASQHTYFLTKHRNSWTHGSKERLSNAYSNARSFVLLHQTSSLARDEKNGCHPKIISKQNTYKLYRRTSLFPFGTSLKLWYWSPLIFTITS